MSLADKVFNKKLNKDGTLLDVIFKKQGHHNHQGLPGKVGGSAPSGGPQSMDAFKEVLDGKNLFEIRKPYTDNPDPLLRVLAEQRGFTAKAEVVSEEKLDELIEQNNPECFRGVKEAGHVEQFQDGDYFAGQGIYGSGIYVATGDEAKQYADGFGDHQMRMTIKDDANIVDKEEVDRLRVKYQEMLDEMAQEASQELVSAQEAGNLDKVEEQNVKLNNTIPQLRELGSDPGRLATMYGIDAIKATEDEMVVLNRNSLIVQEGEV